MGVRSVRSGPVPSSPVPPNGFRVGNREASHQESFEAGKDRLSALDHRPSDRRSLCVASGRAGAGQAVLVADRRGPKTAGPGPGLFLGVVLVPMVFGCLLRRKRNAERPSFPTLVPSDSVSAPREVTAMPEGSTVDAMNISSSISTFSASS